MVRNRLLQDCSDDEHLKIHNAFSTKTFRFLIQFASDPNKSKDQNKILELMKQDQSPKI